MPNIVRTHQILVQVPLQKAFDYVSDLTLHPEWSGGELKIEAVSPGPVAIGKQYRSRGEVGVQKDRPNTVCISAYEPPREFGFVARDPDFGDVSHVFTFKEQSRGTLIERTMTLSLHPIVALLFGFLIYPFVGRPSMDKSLARLKQNLETR